MVDLYRDDLYILQSMINLYYKLIVVKIIWNYIVVKMLNRGVIYLIFLNLIVIFENFYI